MRPMTKLYFLDGNGEKFFGEGPYRLLLAVKEHGSLRAAALNMQMAYTKALKLLKVAESAFGFELIERQKGGRDGGSSRLTENAEEIVRKYEIYRERCHAACTDIFDEIFGE